MPAREIQLSRQVFQLYSRSADYVSYKQGQGSEKQLCFQVFQCYGRFPMLRSVTSKAGEVRYNCVSKFSNVTVVFQCYGQLQTRPGKRDATVSASLQCYSYKQARGSEVQLCLQVFQCYGQLQARLGKRYTTVSVSFPMLRSFNRLKQRPGGEMQLSRQFPQSYSRSTEDVGYKSGLGRRIRLSIPVFQCTCRSADYTRPMRRDTTGRTLSIVFRSSTNAPQG